MAAAGIEARPPLRASARLLERLGMRLARLAPAEGVGLVLGREGVARCAVLLPNGSAGPRCRFEVPACSLLATLRAAEAHRLSVVALFHSHPDAGPGAALELSALDRASLSAADGSPLWPEAEVWLFATSGSRAHALRRWPAGGHGPGRLIDVVARTGLGD